MAVHDSLAAAEKLYDKRGAVRATDLAGLKSLDPAELAVAKAETVDR